MSPSEKSDGLILYLRIPRRQGRKDFPHSDLYRKKKIVNMWNLAPRTISLSLILLVWLQ